MAANPGLVTVFGASGFLGRYVVRALTSRGWRVRAAVRNPHTAHELKVIGDVGQVQLMQRQTFEALLETGPDTIGEACAAAGIANVAHVSALGVSADSASEYSRTKYAGEMALRSHVPSTDIMRPSIIFGPEDEFFNRFAGLFVEDVASAVAISVTRGSAGKTYELGGPQSYKFKTLMQFILETIGKKRLLAPVPWFGANMMGFMGELSGALPFVTPFLTRDQVENLRTDNVVSEDAVGFEAFDIRPATIESIVPSYLAKYRKYGQFYEKRDILDEAA